MWQGVVCPSEKVTFEILSQQDLEIDLFASRTAPPVIRCIMGLCQSQALCYTDFMKKEDQDVIKKTYSPKAFSPKFASRAGLSKGCSFD